MIRIIPRHLRCKVILFLALGYRTVECKSYKMEKGYLEASLMVMIQRGGGTAYGRTSCSIF